MRTIKLLAVIILFLTETALAATDGNLIVVCYPGGNVSAEDANAAMTSMLRVVERVGQWPANTFKSLFTTKSNDCRTQMDAKKPKFAINSLGLFLDLRERHQLIPLVQPRIKGSTSERYRVVVPKGKYKNLDELKGKMLGGTVLDDPAFIGKIVFAGKIDPGSFFQVKSSSQAIRTLRALDKGQIDAVILNDQQFGGLAALHLQTPLDPVFTSEEIPLMGLVANRSGTTDEERSRFAKAMADMCNDAEGTKLCQLFGVEAFVAADSAMIEPFIKLWEQGK